MTHFTDRATYIAFVAAWKNDYAALSKDIRLLKRAIADQQSSGALCGDDQAKRERWRERATAMLEQRAAAKREAQRQYLAAMEAA